MNIQELKKQDKKHAQRIADYLLERIETDLPLREKLESTTKTLKGCVDYCKEQDEILINLYRIINNIIKVEDNDYKLFLEEIAELVDNEEEFNKNVK